MVSYTELIVGLFSGHKLDGKLCTKNLKMKNNIHWCHHPSHEEGGVEKETWCSFKGEQQTQQTLSPSCGCKSSDKIDVSTSCQKALISTYLRS